MLTFLKRKTPAPLHRSAAQAESIASGWLLPVRMAEGHARWNLILEEELTRRLEGMGIPLAYHPEPRSNSPSREECEFYGYESLLGRSALDEGILLRRNGCKQLYPRFLAILGASPLCLLAKPGGEILISGTDVPYVAVFTNLFRAQDGQKTEGKDYPEILEKSGEALLKRYANHGFLLNLGSPGVTFAIPPEIINELRGALGCC